MSRFIFFTESPTALNANDIDLDQTMDSVVSDLGLHCLPQSLLWAAKHECVKYYDFNLT